MLKKTLLVLALSSLSVNVFAQNQFSDLADVYLPGVSYQALMQLANSQAIPSAIGSEPYTIISYTDYQKILSQSQNDVNNMIKQINGSTDPTRILQIAGQYLQYVPYGGGQGEGDWCDAGLNKTGCMHIQQDLTYRTDTLNCQTFVQLVLALLNAHDLQSYNKNFVSIAYGAEANGGYPTDEVMSYANRNNFPDGDFNPVNQKAGLLTDVTGQGVFAPYVQSVPANITRANWFAFQYKPTAIAGNVHVFTDAIGQEMSAKFADNYGNFYLPETVNTGYIPKQALVIQPAGPAGQYTPNEQLINQIPTPSVLEVVRDDSKWFITINGKPVNIVDLIGSGLSVSHMAFLYRQQFNQGDTIYQKTYCYLNSQNAQECTVTPVTCNQQNGCTETMMLAATDAYPNSFVWTHNPVTNQYNCVDPNKVPVGSQVLTTCNRVTAIPFGDYVTFQYNNQYIYMQSPSIVGFNIQKINE